MAFNPGATTGNYALWTALAGLSVLVRVENRVDADRRLGHVRSRELRADGPPCDAEGDDIRLLQ